MGAIYEALSLTNPVAGDSPPTYLDCSFSLVLTPDAGELHTLPDKRKYKRYRGY